VAVVALVATSGCAARWAYRQAEDAAAHGEWDLAVARYTKALEKDAKNIGYKIALENARIQASRVHYDKAREHLAASDFEKAAEELEIATKYDPANRSAADDLTLVRERIRKREEEERERAAFEQTKARAQAAARVPLPVLSPRSPVPITMRFEDGSLQKILESLGRIAGVNVLFDEGFRDKKASVNLSGISFEEALDRITFVNRLFYKVLDQNTIIVVPESRQKRTSYDELLLRTFYVQNAEINETVNLVKTLARLQLVAGNPALNAITVLGTAHQVAMAERIIDANDKARGEVVVEVRILEVNRNNIKRWGIDLSNYTAAMTLSPTGAQDEITAGLLSIRAHLLSSLNRADWVVSIPSTVFARFLETDANVRILASPRLRAAEGKKAELKIGQEVPVPVTSYTVGTGGTTGYLPATSFQYRNVGVNLTLEPRVAASGDITLQLTAEFSLLGEDRNVGSADNPITVPTFLTRNVVSTLRLRDGETGLIGGLLQGRDARTFSGAIGVGSIPVIGKLFGDNRRQVDETEVLISITPRIVRAPKVTGDDMVPLRVGTQEVPKVESASPPLFGPEPEAPPGAGVPPATPPAAPQGARELAPPQPAAPAAPQAAAPGPTRGRPRGRGRLPAGRRGGRAPGLRDPEPAGGGRAAGSGRGRRDRGGGRARRPGSGAERGVGRGARRGDRRRPRLAAEPGRRAGLGRARARAGPGAREVLARLGGHGLGRGGRAHAAGSEAGVGVAGRRVAVAGSRRGGRAAGAARARAAGGGAVRGGARRIAMWKGVRLTVGLALLAAGVALLMPACEAVPLTAAPGTELTLIANPTFVIANGGLSIVTAILVEPAGTFVPDGTEVFFFTDLGRVDASGKTVNGVARVNFVSDARSGIATVIAISGGPAPSAPTTTTTTVAAGFSRPGASGVGVGPGAAGIGAGGPAIAAATGIAAAQNSGSVTIAVGSALPQRVAVTADPPAMINQRSSRITATVFDGFGNPVQNVPVSFSIDLSVNEFLDSGGAFMYTNSNGQVFDTLRTRAAVGDTGEAVEVKATTATGVAGMVSVFIE
jgi:general secretion pathway protein D